MKEQDKIPETDLNEMKIRDLPDKEFNIMFIEMLTKVRKTMYEESEYFSRDRKHKKAPNKKHISEEYDN